MFSMCVLVHCPTLKYLLALNYLAVMKQNQLQLEHFVFHGFNEMYGTKSAILNLIADTCSIHGSHKVTWTGGVCSVCVQNSVSYTKQKLNVFENRVRNRKMKTA
jgi:hypothetical protein